MEKLTAKDAAMAASKYYREITAYEGPLTVEEIELLPETPEDPERWVVTLGVQELISAMLGSLGGKKTYKSFTIAAHNGAVMSMKIREVKA